MAYTLAGIRQRILDDKLDDTTFNGSIVDRFVNDVQRSIFNTYELPFQEKEWNGVAAEGEHSFEFPEDYQTEQALIIVDPEGNVKDITDNYLPWRDFISIYPLPENNPAGSPQVWTAHANKLHFSRPFDDDYTLALWYLKKPDTLTDDADIPEVPSEFEEVLVLGGYIKVLERNEDFDLAAYYKQGDYTDEVQKMVSRLGRRQTGQALRIRQPQRVTRGRSRGRV